MSRLRGTAPASALLVVALLAPSGCGLSDDNPPGQLSADDWSERASGFCSDSAGRAASGLGLEECAAFVAAVAPAP